MSDKKSILNGPISDEKKAAGLRLQQVRYHLGMKQAEIVAPIGLSSKAYSSVENGQNGFSEQLLRGLARLYKVDLTWLLTGVGTMFLADSSVVAESAPAYPNKTEIITVTVDSAGEENIVLVGNKARGGYPLNYMEREFLSDLPAFSLPGARYRNGTFRAFEVAGDSMQSTIYAGDIVIAQKLYNWATEIREGYVHIIVTKDDVLVKRVLNRLVDSGHLVLKSDNAAYPSQLLEGDDVLEVWVAKAKISPQFINPRYDGAREQFQIQANLAELTAELDDFKRAVAEKLGVAPRELSLKKSSRK